MERLICNSKIKVSFFEEGVEVNAVNKYVSFLDKITCLMIKGSQVEL